MAPAGRDDDTPHPPRRMSRIVYVDQPEHAPPHAPSAITPRTKLTVDIAKGVMLIGAIFYFGYETRGYAERLGRVETALVELKAGAKDDAAALGYKVLTKATSSINAKLKGGVAGTCTAPARGSRKWQCEFEVE